MKRLDYVLKLETIIGSIIIMGGSMRLFREKDNIVTILKLRITIAWVVTVSEMSQFPSQSSYHVYMWSWTCSQCRHVP